jgi:hypothetical protein
VSSASSFAVDPTWTGFVWTLVFRALRIEPQLDFEGNAGIRMLHAVEKTKFGVVFQRMLRGAHPINSSS